MEIDMLSIIEDLEEAMNKALIEKFLADKDIQLLIECLHNNGMSYKNILKTFLKFDDKKKKEKEK